MNISDAVKESFKNNPFLTIHLQNHVSGFRVSLYDIELGEINTRTGSCLEKTIIDCLGTLEDIKSKKIENKILKLEKEKNNIEMELEEVNKKLSKIKLNIFSYEN